MRAFVWRLGPCACFAVSPDTPAELLPKSDSDSTRFLAVLFFTLEAVS